MKLSTMVHMDKLQLEMERELYNVIMKEVVSSINSESNLEHLDLEESIETVNRQYNHLRSARTRRLTRKVPGNDKIDFDKLNQKVNEIHE